MLKVININEFAEQQQNLSEAAQFLDLRFAFGKKVSENEVKPTTPFVRCRDYFSDSLVAYKLGETIGPVYGFTGTRDQIQDTIFIITGQEIEISNILSNWDFLNRIEFSYDIPLTTVSSVDSKTLVVFFDKVYLSNTLILNWLTLIIRLMAYKVVKSDLFDEVRSFLKTNTIFSTDGLFFSSYWEKGTKNIKNLNLSKLLTDTSCVFKKERDNYGIHSSSGIFTYLITDKSYYKDEFLQ